jgi:hypothetical protein
VILVAVAIVIAIAVAFWASGLVGVFTRFEKLEIVSAIMTDERTFIVRIRNTGSADSALIQVVVQGRGIGQVPADQGRIRVGETLECTVRVGNSPPPGITVELTFYSAGGKTYPTAVLATLGTGEKEVRNQPGSSDGDSGCGGDSDSDRCGVLGFRASRGLHEVREDRDSGSLLGPDDY